MEILRIIRHLVNCKNGGHLKNIDVTNAILPPNNNIITVTATGATDFKLSLKTDTKNLEFTTNFSKNF